MAVKNYTRLRDMPKELADAVRLFIREQAANAPPESATYDGIARALAPAFTTKEYTVALSRDVVRDVLKRQKVQAQAFEVKNRPPTREEAEEQRRKELRDLILDSANSLRPVPTHIQATRIEDMGFDTPETMVPLFSDLHYGAKIDRRASGGLAEYDIDLARERLVRWRDSVLRFAQMRQIFMKVPNLAAFDLGDDFEGHGLMFPTQAMSMCGSVEHQVAGFTVDMTQIILDLTQRFEHCVWYKVYGNHGRVTAQSKQSYGPDNMELWAWQMIADAVSKQTGGEWVQYGEGADKYVSPNGIMSLTGGLVDFHIARPFFLMTDIEGWSFYARHGHKIGGLRRTYCVAPEMRILTRDLRWVPAGELRTGDKLIAVDKQAGCYNGNGRVRRRFRDAEAIVHGRQEDDLYEVELADGRVLRCNGEHKWLTKNAAGNTRWHSTIEMFSYFADAEKGGRTRQTFRLLTLPVWDEEQTWAAGRIAGALEADGCLVVQNPNKRGDVGAPSVKFAQQENGLLRGMQTSLENRGFRIGQGIATHTKERGNKAVYDLRVNGGLYGTMRLLGSIRPPRLLARWESEVDLSLRDVIESSTTEVVDVRQCGSGEVVLLETTAGTYITEGAINLNTGAYDNKFHMNAIVGEVINFMVKAHLHEAESAEGEIGGEVIQNGCFVGPSLMMLEHNRPVANLPSQEVMFIHPKRRKTQQTRIHLATVEEVRQIEVLNRVPIV